MRNVVLYMITSLDGFIATADGVSEIYDYEPTAEEHQFANEFFGSLDGIVFGRVIYELFVSYWDALDLDDPDVPEVEKDFARLFRPMPRIVFSRSLDAVPENTTLIKDEADDQLASLKRGPGGNLGLVCGPELLAALVRRRLVDEVRILVRPIVLGRGKTLFGEVDPPLPLELLETRAFGSGVVVNRYRPMYGA